jgi:hypothetical protein
VSYDSNTKTVTFTPDNKLEPDTVYAVLVANVADLAGNVQTSKAGLWYWTFTTTADGTPPSVLHAYPGDGDVNVPLNAALTIRMTEALDANSVGGNILMLRDSSGNPVSGRVSYEEKWGDYLIYFIPDGSLSPGMTYNVRLHGVEDLAGNVMTPCEWSFTTTSDVTPPGLTYVTPPDGYPDIPRDFVVRAYFNEDLDPNYPALIKLVDSSGNPVPGTTSQIESGVHFQPDSPLTPGMTYTATVYNARDAVGNYAEPYTWSFAVSSDVTPPHIESYQPSDGDTHVLPDVVPVIEFSERMENIGTFTLVDGAGVQVEGYGLSWVGDNGNEKMAFHPYSLLALDMDYTARIVGAMDEAHNVMDPFEWSFHTSAEGTLPTVGLTYPVPSANDVPVDAVITATISEAIDPATVSQASLTVVDTLGNPVTGIVSFVAPDTLAFTPDSALKSSWGYGATVSGVKDLAGNEMASPYTWWFSTVSM